MSSVFQFVISIILTRRQCAKEVEVEDVHIEDNFENHTDDEM